MRDALLQALAPALSLEQLLKQGASLGAKLSERARRRPPQMAQLVKIIEQTRN
jgi:hypothetical protein